MTRRSQADPPDVRQLSAFLAVVATGSKTKGAHQLAAQGIPLSAQRIGQIIKDIDKWWGGATLRVEETLPGKRLVLTEDGRRLLKHARKVVTDYEEMAHELLGEGNRPKLACLPDHIHLIARLEEILLAEAPVGTEKVDVKYLEQQDRGDEAFEEHAIWLLERDLYQIIIGPPPRASRYAAKMRSQTLYTVRLEAMLRMDYPADTITVAELINRRLLLPPPTLQSRRLLEHVIKKYKVKDPDEDVRVAGESYDIHTSVLRVLNERSHHTDDHQIVVASSDVALVFRCGWEFGGRGPAEFKWVPIHHDGEPLRHDVNVTTATARPTPVYNIVRALEQACADLAPLTEGAIELPVHSSLNSDRRRNDIEVRFTLGARGPGKAPSLSGRSHVGR